MNRNTLQNLILEVDTMSKNKSIKHTTEAHTHCRQCGAPIYVRTEYMGGKVREIVNRLCECEPVPVK